MGRVVLVTGVSGAVGGRFARQVAGLPGVDRVIGVDVTPPRAEPRADPGSGSGADLAPVDFVRADIRNPVIAKVIAGRDVDTVVHLSVGPATDGGRASSKEHNVIGSMQLLAACQRAPGLRRLVVRSSTEVYGSSSRDPAMFTEDLDARRTPRGGYAKDVLEVEGYVRGFARRRPDVTVTMLRAARVVGPQVATPLTQYLRLPVLPTPLGFDARLQLLHDADLLGALRHACLHGVHGTFNVAGAGILMLSQVVRRLGRPTAPVPPFALTSLGSTLRRFGVDAVDPGLASYLTFGRGVDTTRMREVLGFEPRFSTEAAFADFAASVPSGPVPGSLPLADRAARRPAAMGGGGGHA